MVENVWKAFLWSNCCGLEVNCGDSYGAGSDVFLRQIKELPRISSNAQCLVVMWKRNDPMLIPSFTFFMVFGF
ncbi:hypothetical protein SynA1560_02464 [Synechococcus sp. A15-60]|nr:hypothetical protein SynA1560_02464 [Synechococcus sp. A15-60]